VSERVSFSPPFRMSNLLWQYYHNDEVERFRHLLQYGSPNTQYSSKGYAGGTGAHSVGSIVGSPSGFATSPRTNIKHRKVSGQPGNAGGMKGSSTPLSRAELNSRDYAGLTILHRACSSTSENAISFAMTLLEHPAIDLYIQDNENGWTALHRALYFGNITLARAIIEKDTRDPSGQIGNTAQRAASSVIKVKDREGNSPFDVYNATIARRSLHLSEERGADDGSQDDAESVNDVLEGIASESTIDGDEIFAWGSSRNHGLGFKDQDDRQHPEKITLQRPDHLLFRFYREHLESTQVISDTSNNKTSTSFPKSVSELPTLVSNRPIVIQDVALSKLHSAILTTDPESNLFMCGFGPGGRLGTGDETTRFSYTCIEEGSLAGKKIMTVALGQNHTLAVSSDGSVHSWGTNSHGQLGYTLPKPAMKDEEPVCATPRQIFGPLKREVVIGVAASAIHSVAHTSTSLFTWGKNEGQLGLMDSDSRNLEVQTTPRKVAASLFKAPINMVSAINGATVVLLANYTVCVFTNYGYNIVKFPLHEGFTNYHLKTSALTTRYDPISNHISHITAGGDTIAATSSRGDLFTFIVRKLDNQPTTSTTNPSKIRDSLSPPQRIWTLRKGNWDGIRSVGITENGSVLVCTQAGAVWQRVKRAKIKDTFLGASAFNRKDFKFQRVPGLTKVVAVRSTTFGVYAAVRKDCNVTRTQIEVGEQNLWNDVAPLLSIQHLEASKPVGEEDIKAPRFSPRTLPRDVFDPLKKAILMSPDPEADISKHLIGQDVERYDIEICTTTSEVGIPVHSFILGRSPVFRKVLNDFRRIGTASIPDILVAEESSMMESGVMIKDNRSQVRITFQGLDFMVIANLAVYLYTDTVIDVWNFLRHSPSMAFRYRQVRVELMKIAGYLKLGNLESAVRLMTKPERRMNVDFGMAIQDPGFFDNGDLIAELDDAEMLVHSDLLCRRCPFFDGLFNGRAAGQWLAGRRQESEIVRVDLKHVLSGTFKLVLRYLYSDVGITLFDDVVSTDIDEFSELVMDVMAVANELMLDRLSEICQQVIGRFGKLCSEIFILSLTLPQSALAMSATFLMLWPLVQ
jgi:alpha-tubulin suppressor-like RCC1 family protein